MFFEYPYLLWLLVLPVLLLALYLYRELKERRPHLRVSTVTPWEKGGKSILGWASSGTFRRSCASPPCA